ncbi:C-type lectin BpLec-like [Poecilia formosa]|uniref:C-type lectin BpLec-like n=1 Tax=Poecilia formosa TaxID=48698 RepID=UPI0007BAB65B|nr:PREDICTED: C-type lectin BpLec-like [Poecilia formosa]
MNQQMTAVLLLFGLCLSSCSQFPPRWYFYVNQPLTWTQAQQYCREHYTNLATFENMDDINALQAPFSYSSAWIGLWDDPNAWKSELGNGPNSWRWSATGETSKTGYKSWSSNNPDYYMATETCVALYYDGIWTDVPCSSSYTFICYNVTKQNVKREIEPLYVNSA